MQSYQNFDLAGFLSEGDRNVCEPPVSSIGSVQVTRAHVAPSGASRAEFLNEDAKLPVANLNRQFNEENLSVHGPFPLNRLSPTSSEEHAGSASNPPL